MTSQRDKKEDKGTNDAPGRLLREKAKLTLREGKSRISTNASPEKLKGNKKNDASNNRVVAEREHQKAEKSSRENGSLSKTASSFKGKEGPEMGQADSGKGQSKNNEQALRSGKQQTLEDDSKDGNLIKRNVSPSKVQNGTVEKSNRENGSLSKTSSSFKGKKELEMGQADSGKGQSKDNEQALRSGKQQTPKDDMKQGNLIKRNVPVIKIQTTEDPASAIKTGQVPAFDRAEAERILWGHVPPETQFPPDKTTREKPKSQPKYQPKHKPKKKTVDYFLRRINQILIKLRKSEGGKEKHKDHECNYVFQERFWHLVNHFEKIHRKTYKSKNPEVRREENGKAYRRSLMLEHKMTHCEHQSSYKPDAETRKSNIKVHKALKKMISKFRRSIRRGRDHKDNFRVIMIKTRDKLDEDLGKRKGKDGNDQKRRRSLSLGDERRTSRVSKLRSRSLTRDRTVALSVSFGNAQIFKKSSQFNIASEHSSRQNLVNRPTTSVRRNILNSKRIHYSYLTKHNRKTAQERKSLITKLKALIKERDNDHRKSKIHHSSEVVKEEKKLLGKIKHYVDAIEHQKRNQDMYERNKKKIRKLLRRIKGVHVIAVEDERSQAAKRRRAKARGHSRQHTRNK